MSVVVERICLNRLETAVGCVGSVWRMVMGGCIYHGNENRVR